MKFKKQISLLLCVAVIFSSATLPSYASDGTKTGTPAIINIAEEITGIVINNFAKTINNITGTDETAIPSIFMFKVSSSWCIFYLEWNIYFSWAIYPLKTESLISTLQGRFFWCTLYSLYSMFEILKIYSCYDRRKYKFKNS